MAFIHSLCNMGTQVKGKLTSSVMVTTEADDDVSDVDDEADDARKY